MLRRSGVHTGTSAGGFSTLMTTPSPVWISCPAKAFALSRCPTRAASCLPRGVLRGARTPRPSRRRGPPHSAPARRPGRSSGRRPGATGRLRSRLRSQKGITRPNSRCSASGSGPPSMRSCFPDGVWMKMASPCPTSRKVTVRRPSGDVDGPPIHTTAHCEQQVRQGCPIGSRPLPGRRSSGARSGGGANCRRHPCQLAEAIGCTGQQRVVAPHHDRASRRRVQAGRRATLQRRQPSPASTTAAPTPPTPLRCPRESRRRPPQRTRPRRPAPAGVAGRASRVTGMPT